MKADLIIDRYSKNGKHDVFMQESRSFLKNFILALEMRARQSNKSGFIDVNGNSFTGEIYYNESSSLYSFGSYGENVHPYNDASGHKGHDIGIVVGTGDAEVTIQDYKLSSKIEHGTDNGQLIYYGCGYDEDKVVVDDQNGVAYFNMFRLFENKSGATITIKEAGIYSNIPITPYGSQKIVCICRDVLDTPVDVNDGDLIKVTYKIKVTI